MIKYPPLFTYLSHSHPLSPGPDGLGSDLENLCRSGTLRPPAAIKPPMDHRDYRSSSRPKYASGRATSTCQIYNSNIGSYRAVMSSFCGAGRAVTKGRPAAGRNTRYGERLPGATPPFIRRRKEARTMRIMERLIFLSFFFLSRDTVTSRKTGIMRAFSWGSRNADKTDRLSSWCSRGAASFYRLIFSSNA